MSNGVTFSFGRLRSVLSTLTVPPPSRNTTMSSGVWCVKRRWIWSMSFYALDSAVRRGNPTKYHPRCLVASFGWQPPSSTVPWRFYFFLVSRVTVGGLIGLQMQILSLGQTIADAAACCPGRASLPKRRRSLLYNTKYIQNMLADLATQLVSLMVSPNGHLLSRAQEVKAGLQLSRTCPVRDRSVVLSWNGSRCLEYQDKGRPA